MGKAKKPGGGGIKSRSQERTRLNYLTGSVETVPGTKAGKKRQKLQFGHPLRTHDLRAPAKEKRKSKPIF